MSIEHISLREFSSTERDVIQKQLQSICIAVAEKRRTSMCKQNPGRGEGKHTRKPVVEKNIRMECKKNGLVQDVIMRSDSVWVLKNTQLAIEGVASASHHRRRITRHGESMDAKGVLFIDCIFVVREGEDTTVLERLLDTVHTFAAISGFTCTATLAISKPFPYTSSDRKVMEHDSNSQWVDRFSDLWSMWHDMGYTVDKRALQQLEHKHGLFLHDGLVMDNMIHATMPQREARIRLLGMPISKLTKTARGTIMTDADLPMPKKSNPPKMRETMDDEGGEVMSEDTSTTKSNNDIKSGSVDSDGDNDDQGSHTDGTGKYSDESSSDGPIHSSDKGSSNRSDDSSSTMGDDDDSDSSADSSSTVSTPFKW
jgi:hypothetical protein